MTGGRVPADANSFQWFFLVCPVGRGLDAGDLLGHIEGELMPAREHRRHRAARPGDRRRGLRIAAVGALVVAFAWAGQAAAEADFVPGRSIVTTPTHKAQCGMLPNLVLTGGASARPCPQRG